MADYLYWVPVLLLVFLAVYLIYEYRKYELDKHQLTLDRYKQRPVITGERVLKRGTGQLAASQQKQLVVVAFLMIVLVMMMTVLSAVKDPQDLALREVLLSLARHYGEHPAKLINLLLMLLMLVVGPVILIAVMKNEKLVLTSSGITYHPPFKNLNIPGILQGWHMDWADVESVSLGGALSRGQLTLKTAQGKSRVLMVHAWHDPQDNTVRTAPSIFSNMGHLRRLQTDPDYAMQASPLLRFITDAAGLDIWAKEHASLNFDLMGNQYTRTGVVILFIMLAYTFFDFILNDETYVEVPALSLFVAGGVIAAASFVVWFKKHAVPTDNALGLAALLGVVAGLALYPGLLRINQFTDAQGLKAHTYRQVAGPRFEPVEPGLPVIVMFDDPYWNSLPADTETVFRLRKGGLDFYQLDMAPVYRQTRLWYCMRNAKGDEARIRRCAHEG